MLRSQAGTIHRRHRHAEYLSLRRRLLSPSPGRCDICNHRKRYRRSIPGLVKDAYRRFDSCDIRVIKAMLAKQGDPFPVGPRASQSADVKRVGGQRALEQWQLPVKVVEQQRDCGKRVNLRSERIAFDGRVYLLDLIAGRRRHSGGCRQFDRSSANKDADNRLVARNESSVGPADLVPAALSTELH